MSPTFFAESNCVMRRPKDMTGEQCFDVHAFRDGTQVVTCWQPTPEERVKIAIGEPVWLILIGPTMQPAMLTADKPFVEAGT